MVFFLEEIPYFTATVMAFYNDGDGDKAMQSQLWKYPVIKTKQIN